jgi:hypothetical protein
MTENTFNIVIYRITDLPLYTNLSLRLNQCLILIKYKAIYFETFYYMEIHLEIL